MIEGLKVTISGRELTDICEDRAAHHFKRADVYGEQIKSMESNRIEAAPMTNGDPIAALKSQRDSHSRRGNEMTFIAAHIVPDEDYLLDDRDLEKIGVIESRHNF